MGVIERDMVKDQRYIFIDRKSEVQAKGVIRLAANRSVD